MITYGLSKPSGGGPACGMQFLFNQRRSMTLAPKFRRLSHSHRYVRLGLHVEAVEARLLFATFVVDTTADSGPGSLREAIVGANANDAVAPVDDEILFNIAPAGPHTIGVLSQLPEITGNVTIDATTQPGYEPSRGPVIVLDGRAAGAGASGLRIASTGPTAASNLIGLAVAGFAGNGLEISGRWNSVAHSRFGADPAGSAAGPGNGGHGVLITGGNNLLVENTIASNGLDGVAVAGGSVGNTLAPNTYFSNAGMPIDLGDDGPTANDPADADDGANRRQNSPVITSIAPAAAPASGFTVSGTVDTTPNMLVEVVLYSSPTGDGEGRAVLAVLPPQVTDASGSATFAANLPAAAPGDWLTATVTSYAFSGETSEANTSEFSPPVVAPGPLTRAYVRGVSWAGPDADPANVTFKEYLEATGLGDDVYGFEAGNLPPGTTLPWINLNQIVIDYRRPLAAGGLPAAQGIVVDGQLSDYAVTAVDQFDATTVVLTLDRALGVQPAGSADPTLGDRVTVTVPGAGPTEVPVVLTLNVLQGDADRAANGRVGSTDSNFVKARLNRTAGEIPPAGAQYTAFADLDGSGRISSADINAAKARLNDVLPAPTDGAGSAPVALFLTATRELFGSSPIL